MSILHIAVIGTGNMGAPMALNLAKAGFQVSIYDIVHSKMQAVASASKPHPIRVGHNHLDAIKGADIIWTMLPTSVEVKSVFYDQLFGHCPTRCILIDSSTSDLNDTKKLHEDAAQEGYAMLDAPVSGGTQGAQNGALSFMVGGASATLGAARPAFEAMGKTLIHCGAGGMGQAAKMCNNLMLGIQMISVAEGFKLAQSIGLDQQTLFDVATKSSGDCFALRTFCPVAGLVATAPSSHGFNPGFASALMLKDMRLALAAAQANQLNLSIGSHAAKHYEQLVELGQADVDFSAVIKLIETSGPAQATENLDSDGV